MKVGLDAFTIRELGLDADGLLEYTRNLGLEVLHFNASYLEPLSPGQIDDLAAKSKEYEIGLELAGPTFNPGRQGKTVAEIVDQWRDLFPLSEKVGSSFLNTSFGLLKERTMTSPTFDEQIEMSQDVLRTLAPIAADHGVTITIEIHVDLTSKEIVRVLENVNSPNVAVNLDTANACGLMEDPVEVARRLAPYARTTHFKDCNVYSAEGGYHWTGGSLLGRGVVDLPAIVDILYQANPDISLNIEDCGGYIPIPLEDEAFLASFPDLESSDLVSFMGLLRNGADLIRSGIQLTPEENMATNWKDAIPGRLPYNVAYTKSLRDQAVAKFK